MEMVMFIGLGIGIGVLSGFFGIGGGIILTPLLLIMGKSPSEAIALSLLLTLGSTVTGAFSHAKRKNVVWRDAAIIGGSGALTSMVLAPLVVKMDNVEWAGMLTSLLYIVILSVFAYRFLKKRTAANTTSDGQRAGFAKLSVIGIAAGVVSSLMGVSGGFVLTPLLTGWVRYDLKRAIGTGVAAAMLIVTLGLATHIGTGAGLPYMSGIFLIAGALLGTPFGTKRLLRFKDRTVDRLLGGFYVVVAVSVTLKLVHASTSALFLLIGVALYLIGYISFRSPKPVA
ncbi:sulfite exporter TauE/SafE family protein [Exiguobacterium flavidum]|uniref:sulfite exporter TauE/SafE family protein n=1 Tax=Exiguobacterium flavidum TaxID=2184695 RepID=UPI000DF77414|nr:sulfite exporter TauE/SafE family protein [Exiguobacterium flavidum]